MAQTDADFDHLVEQWLSQFTGENDVEPKPEPTPICSGCKKPKNRYAMGGDLDGYQVEHVEFVCATKGCPARGL